MTLVVPSTTWLFVRISPRRSKITPEPPPSPPPNELVWTLTTEGSTRSTAAAIEPGAGGSGGTAGVGADTVGSGGRWRCGLLVVVAAAAAGEQRRRGDEREKSHGSLGKVTTAIAAAASRSARPPARNANVTSCFRSTLLTTDPILSYASRRSSTFSAS